MNTTQTLPPSVATAILAPTPSPLGCHPYPITFFINPSNNGTVNPVSPCDRLHAIFF